MQTIVSRVAEHAKKTPERPAVIFEHDSIDYGTLWDRALRTAALFRSLGVKHGDRVIVQGKYTAWFVVCAFASHLNGAVFIPVDKAPQAEAVAQLAQRVGARLVVSDYHFDPVCCLDFEELEKKALPQPADEAAFPFPSLDDTADMMFTTGTTGAPKGVELTHRNIACTAETRVHECRILPDNVGITLVPMNHVAPMRELYLNAYNGSTFIFVDGMSKIKLLFDYMKQYHVTSFYVPPAGITLISQLAKKKLGEFQDQLDYVYTGSAPMQVSQQEYMREMLPRTRLYFSYGSSENGSVCLHRYDRDLKDITCCGRPCKGVALRIMDENFADVPQGRPGRIAIKSDMNMKGYYQMPELNDSVFKDGWFLSNDVGFIDEEGFLFVSGRKDDIINIGGLKVYPSEIEIAALKIPGITDCVCYAVKDAVSGQAAKLLIKVSPDFSGGIPDVKKALGEMMDAYKVPKTVAFVGEIARTSNGKIDRKFYMQQEA